MTTKIHNLHGSSWCYRDWNYYQSDSFNSCGTTFGDFDRGLRCVYSIDKERITGLRVLLGGSWGSLDSYYFNAHYRNRLYPDLKSVWQGFRCVYLVKAND